LGFGALLAVLVGVTRSFTQPAAVLLGFSLLLLVVVVALQLLLDEPPALIARRAPPANATSEAAPRRAGWIVWATAIGAALTWQFWNYFHSPRSDYPTISHLLDGLVHPAGVGRGVGFAIWLAIAWYLVTR
jgi:hypothetical protein